MTGGADPTKGLQISSNYANYTKKSNIGGGGSGTFNAVGVTPVLTAPTTAGGFSVTAAPENTGSGYYYTPGGGGIYYASQSVSAN